MILFCFKCLLYLNIFMVLGLLSVVQATEDALGQATTLSSTAVSVVERDDAALLEAALQLRERQPKFFY